MMPILIPLLCMVAAFLLFSLIQRIELRPWLQSEGQHWALRARILWPIRRSHTMMVIYLPIVISATANWIDPAGMQGSIPRWLAALVGAACAGWQTTRVLHPKVGFRRWLRHLCIGGILNLGFWAILAIGIAIMPKEFNARMGLTLAGVLTVQLLWPTLSILVLRMTRMIEPAGERLRAIVERCCQQSGIVAKRVWQAKSITANAMAFPVSGTLIFYEVLLDELTDDEVAAVCSHEIGHLAESTPAIIGRVLSMLMFTPLLLLPPAFAHWSFAGFLIIIAGVFLWAQMSVALAHRLELRADKAAEHHQAQPDVYARALEKIHRINHLPATFPSKRLTHPDLYDRMLAAGTKPDFPRPMRPLKYTALGWCVVIGVPMVLFAMFGASQH